MADFLTAFTITMQTEGGYNPGVGEAETYMGVDRSQNPSWSGWNLINQIKIANPVATLGMLNSLFKANSSLQSAVQQFYKSGYWNPLLLDKIIDQLTANALFDGADNPCIISVGRAAQIACNVVRHKAVNVDGKVGQLTIDTINSLSPSLYVTAFNGVRVANYYERIRLTPADGQWLDSWLDRCRAYQ